MVWMCSWGSTWLIWAIVWEVERQNHVLPLLGLETCEASNRPVQADSVQTDTTNGFRRSDLGGQGLLFLCIRVILQVRTFSSPEKTTGARAPASLTSVEDGEASVAQWSFLIRSFYPPGVHQLTVFLTSLSNDACCS